MFTDNSSYWNGGGVFNAGTLATISNSVFNGNTARLSGGGVYNPDNAMTIVNTTVSDNSAHGGGGVFNGGTLTLSNSTISGNTAVNAGGVYNYKNTLTIYNSIIANSVSGVECHRADGTVNVEHSVIEGGLTCVNGTNNNNLTSDPALNVDLTLSASSPAINAGNNSLIPVGITTDLAGNARIQQSTVDMGAYESAYAEATPLVTISVPDDAGAEAGADIITFQVTRSFATAAALTVNYVVTGIAVASDYTPSLVGSVSIPANATVADITLTPVDDALDESDETLTLTLVDDTAYDLGSPNSATATIVDNDTAGVAVNPSSGLITTESGTTASFTVKLSSQPTADVVINLSSGDTSEGTVSPSSLTFTSANWNTEQTVTVTGVDDAVVDGDQPYTIILSAATSSDASYSGFDPSDVSVTNTDDDTATGIPTLSEWALWLLAVLMVGISARRPARRLHA